MRCAQGVNKKANGAKASRVTGPLSYQMAAGSDLRDQDSCLGYRRVPRSAAEIAVAGGSSGMLPRRSSFAFQQMQTSTIMPPTYIHTYHT